ncbi:hypothetical protein CDD80_1195 [Ophiocordyceps camponoti-rufipedis]|uniref:non-specific serine/threonine protein kinase n=1 Tax=Ophiocordyceps camponoti-rufipedis TaxID=2004952 RepID=A0A2C5Z729_9HYPO|nr:hypothetical protein CDD80_1195 [Ophiocordyceps camponoti-rufipedis]
MHIPLEEEQVPGYDSSRYYPANPGERYVALKICNTGQDSEYELDMNKHLISANPQHRGHGALSTAIECFTVDSPRGQNHVVLVFEPLRDTLRRIRHRLSLRNYVTLAPLGLFKTYLEIVAEGLDYMHTQCHVVHTDLKLENIMMTFEDMSTIDALIEEQKTMPMARKYVKDRTVYRSHNNFGPVDSNLLHIIPQITDFDLARRVDKGVPLIEPIQANECQAPEVLFGTGWSYSADMWNFGAMIWEFLGGESLFIQKKCFSQAQHLANIIALHGPPPPELIQREREMRHLRFPPSNSPGAGL